MVVCALTGSLVASGLASRMFVGEKPQPEPLLPLPGGKLPDVGGAGAGVFADGVPQALLGSDKLDPEYCRMGISAMKAAGGGTMVVPGTKDSSMVPPLHYFCATDIRRQSESDELSQHLITATYEFQKEGGYFASRFFEKPSGRQVGVTSPAPALSHMSAQTGVAKVPWDTQINFGRGIFQAGDQFDSFMRAQHTRPTMFMVNRAWLRSGFLNIDQREAMIAHFTGIGFAVGEFPLEQARGEPAASAILIAPPLPQVLERFEHYRRFAGDAADHIHMPSEAGIASYRNEYPQHFRAEAAMGLGDVFVLGASAALGAYAGSRVPDILARLTRRPDDKAEREPPPPAKTGRAPRIHASRSRVESSQQAAQPLANSEGQGKAAKGPAPPTDEQVRSDVQWALDTKGDDRLKQLKGTVRPVLKDALMEGGDICRAAAIVDQVVQHRSSAKREPFRGSMSALGFGPDALERLIARLAQEESAAEAGPRRALLRANREKLEGARRQFNQLTLLPFKDSGAAFDAPAAVTAKDDKREMRPGKPHVRPSQLLGAMKPRGSDAPQDTRTIYEMARKYAASLGSSAEDAGKGDIYIGNRGPLLHTHVSKKHVSFKKTLADGGSANLIDKGGVHEARIAVAAASERLDLREDGDRAEMAFLLYLNGDYTTPIAAKAEIDRRYKEYAGL